MIEIADIIRKHGRAYLQKFKDRIPQTHLKVIQDILSCRTPALGGHVFHCEKCDQEHYSYHSCKNRHCPKCQREENEDWLEKQLQLILPVTYFMVTFTLPEEFRALARSNQRLIYDIFFRASAAALQKLALDPRFIGGKIGMIGVLQTWTRDLFYHPHIHYIVPGGGLSPDGKCWLPADPEFLVHVKPLSIIFRAKFRDELQKAEPKLFEQLPRQTWNKAWVVHSEPVGNGEEALKYVSEYLHRVAISNHRIVDHREDTVTFRFKDPKTHQQRYQTLSAEEFIRRFLQHVLPYRFVKVRYYGFLAPGNRQILEKIRQLTGVAHKDTQDTKPKIDPTAPQTTNPGTDASPKTIPCPTCGKPMTRVREIPRQSRHPP